MYNDVIERVLGSDVADAGTFTVSYPSGRGSGSYSGGSDHRVVSMKYGNLSSLAGDVSFSFGSSEVTVTNNTGQTLEEGTTVYVELDRFGDDGRGLYGVQFASPGKMMDVDSYVLTLGAPIASDADGAVKSQACTAVSGLATGINGDLASGGVATFDIPRAVVAAWTGTAVLTVTGADEYGETVVESSASGTSLTGKKAFKTITGVSTSADITGLTVGTGKVLGLPVFLAGTGYVLAELEDGAAATAGTIVAGVTTTATATTGDVRGTYAPNSAPNGSKAFNLVVVLDDPSNKGVSQYGG